MREKRAAPVGFSARGRVKDSWCGKLAKVADGERRACASDSFRRGMPRDSPRETEMPSEIEVVLPGGIPIFGTERGADPCILVIFGASGDLTKRLLMPALFNLACDRLLPGRFAIVGIAMDEMTTEQFRAKM